MKRKIAFAALLFTLFAFTDVFAETSIKAEVDKSSITTDQTLTYKITITSTEKKVPPPQVPKFEGLNVLSQAQSSTISFAKNDIKTSLAYAFILAPTAIGKFKIWPSQIKVGSKIYSSEEFEIEVSQGKFKPEQPPKQKPSPHKKPLPESEEPQYTL